MRLGGTRPPWAALAALGLALAWLAAQCFWLRPEFVRPEGLFFRDPDDYMRLARVRMIQRGEAGLRIHRMELHGLDTGAPSHWTAPQDLVLLGLARLAALAAGWPDRAREWAGLFVGPALGAATLGWLAWWGWGALGAAGAAAMLILFAFSGAVAETFMLARPDHHGLILAASIVGITAASRIEAAGRKGPRRAWPWAAASAVAVSVGMWTSVEVALVWALVAASWAVAVLAERDAAASSSLARRGAAWSGFGLAASGLFHLIENGGAERLAPALDRISLPHVSLWIVSGAWFALIAMARARGLLEPRTRLWSVGVLAGLALSGAWLAVWLLAASARLPESDPQALRRWFALIDEFQPLLSGDPSRPLRELHGWLGLGVWALPAAVYAVWRGRTWALFPRVLWTATAGLYGLLAFWQLRWAGYAAFAVALVVGAAIGRLVESWAKRTQSERGPGRAGLAFWEAAGVGAALFLSLPGLFDPTGAACARGRQRAAILDDARRVRELTEWMNRRRAGEEGESRSVMAPWWMGSQILYDTGLAVVATPYHSNLDGIADSARFFLSTDDGEAMDILRRRRVGYVLTPSHVGFVLDGRFLLGLTGRRRSREDPFGGADPASLGRIMHQRLARGSGDAPAGLRLAAAGAPEADNQFAPYRLYRVGD